MLSYFLVRSPNIFKEKKYRSDLKMLLINCENNRIFDKIVLFCWTFYADISFHSTKRDHSFWNINKKNMREIIFSHFLWNWCSAFNSNSVSIRKKNQLFETYRITSPPPSHVPLEKQNKEIKGKYSFFFPFFILLSSFSLFNDLLFPFSFISLPRREWMSIFLVY